MNCLWKFAKENHISFGTHKCAVVMIDPNTPAEPDELEEKRAEVSQNASQLAPPQFVWKLGDRVMEVRKSYKYLGIEETFNDDYSEFLTRKKKEVIVKLLDVQKVGGRRGGLNPIDLRKLYFTLIRPKIEFGLTQLPYNDVNINALENLQYKCLRQLFGFLPSTKKETMLVLCGIPSIRMRMATLKLAFANKIINMKNGFYVKEIMKTNWNSSSGLGNDLRNLQTDWSSDPDIDQLCANLIQNQIGCDKHTTFKSKLKISFERCDFERCKRALYESVGRSGQTFLVSAMISNRTTHSLSQQLRVSISRSRMALFTNVLSGCDFLTPYNHAKKPKCKFCGANDVHWVHILFECTETPNHHRFFCSYLASLQTDDPVKVARFTKLKRLLSRLWNQKELPELFKIMMGVGLETYDLCYQELVDVLVATTAEKLSHVDSGWSSLDRDIDG